MYILINTKYHQSVNRVELEKNLAKGNLHVTQPWLGFQLKAGKGLNGMLHIKINAAKFLVLIRYLLSQHYKLFNFGKSPKPAMLVTLHSEQNQNLFSSSILHSLSIPD